MSTTEIPTPDEVVEAVTKKTRRFPKPKLPSKESLRNGAIIVIATAGSILLVQNKYGKTVSLDVTTPDIVEPDSKD